MTTKTLPEQARIVAGMIALGEHIAFGRDTELLMQLADRVDALTKELKDNESDNARVHRQLDHWQVISIHWMNERNTLADQVEALTKERDKLKEAAKLALEALDEAQTYAYNVGKALDEAQKYTYNVGKYMHNVPQAIETLKQAGVQ